MRWIPLLFLLAPSSPRLEDPDSPPSRPNFVVVVGEGCGWSGTSVAMDEAHPEACAPEALTPSLKRLQEQGLRFSAFYAASPRCTPSRASLFTGLSPAALHMTYINEGGTNRRGESTEPAHTKLLPPHPSMELPEGVKTIAQWLAPAGYASAHFGKWHVGRTPPSAHGFTADDGANTNSGPGRNSEPNPEEGVAITERGIAFIEAQVEAQRPFYLHLSHYGGGTSAEVSPEARRLVESLESRGRREKELALQGVVADVDRNLARLLAKLDELGVADSTYVIFTTDHGTQGHGANAPLSGGKGSLLEGGVRVPFLVRGPGIRPGTQSDVRAIGWDLVPTLLELAGIEREKDDALEGGSLVALWRGAESGEVPRRAPFVLHFPHYDLDNGGPMSALYSGPFKLLRSYETGRDSLFDLRRDPGEAQDLADEEPERVKALAGELEAYLASVEAQMPTPNPDHDPEAPPGEPRRGGRGRRER